jgi:hypothetical protein
MITRVTLIGLLVFSAVAMITTDANAQISGWFFRGYSEVTGVIDLRKVKNPDVFPQAVTVEGSLNFIEVICINPQDKTVLPGNAGSQVIPTTGVPITSEDVTDRDKNLATVEIVFGGPQLAAAEAFAEENNVCNNLWTVVEGSAAAKQLSLTIAWTELRKSGEVVRDSVDLSCTINPILRNPDGTPLHEQVISCVEV